MTIPAEMIRATDPDCTSSEVAIARMTASPPTGGTLDGSPLLSLTSAEAEALAFLLPLSEDYPGIESWYRTKVVPGLRTDRRFLLRIERHGQLVGLGIAKSEPDEKKICTVRVAPSHFGRGMGVRIFDTLMRWLDCERPHLTISDAKLPSFERIFDYYRFTLTSARQGLYLRHACELVYNEAFTSEEQIRPASHRELAMITRRTHGPSVE